MATMSRYNHPSPQINIITQWIVLILLLLIGFSVPALFLLGVILSSGGVSLMGVLLFLLGMPLVMYLSATPPITMSDEGMTLHPLFWRDQFVAWESIIDMKPYPLLPTADSEVERRALQGRNKYRVAEGEMLIIPVLPIQYRVTGFFAGERARPVIAITNRTHVDYDELVERIRQSCAHLVQSDTLDSVE